MLELAPEGVMSLWGERPPGVDSRPVRPPSFLGVEPGDGSNQVWFRIPRKLPDDPLLHACLLAYASDLTLLDVIARAAGATPRRAMMASIDHALWFHRPARVDGWLLYDQECPIARGARGLARGEIFTPEGELVASVAQEGLARHRRDPE